MVTLIIAVIGVWIAVSLVTGLLIGRGISRAEREEQVGFARDRAALGASVASARGITPALTD